MEIGMKIFCDDGSTNVKLAWFEGKEKYQEIFEINKKMTEWLVSVWRELSVE